MLGTRAAPSSMASATPSSDRHTSQISCSSASMSTVAPLARGTDQEQFDGVASVADIVAERHARNRHHSLARQQQTQPARGQHTYARARGEQLGDRARASRRRGARSCRTRAASIAVPTPPAAIRAGRRWPVRVYRQHRRWLRPPRRGRSRAPDRRTPHRRQTVRPDRLPLPPQVGSCQRHQDRSL